MSTVPRPRDSSIRESVRSWQVPCWTWSWVTEATEVTGREPRKMRDMGWMENKTMRFQLCLESSFLRERNIQSLCSRRPQAQEQNASFFFFPQVTSEPWVVNLASRIQFSLCQLISYLNESEHCSHNSPLQGENPEATNEIKK